MTGTFWLTTSCNLKCKYCYEGTKKEKKYMDKKVIDAALSFMFSRLDNECKDIQIIIHGGEPFLAFSMIKYLVQKSEEMAVQKGVSIRFITTTNATLLNKEMIDFICKKIKNVTVSIDGNSKTHNFLRPFPNGEDTHKIVVDKLEQLLEQLPNIRTRLTFDSKTVDKLYENIRYIIDLGVKCIVPARDMYDTNWNIELFKIYEEEIKKVKEYIKTKKDVLVSLLDVENTHPLNSCDGGFTSFNFSPEGDIYPCTIAVGNNEFLLGNVFENFNEDLRDRILEYSEILNEECVGCTLYRYCDQTRCKIINKIVNGEYCKPSPISCTEQNLLYRINYK